MSQVKISQLPAANALAGTEVLPVVQQGVTRKATIGQVGSNSVRITGDTMTGPLRTTGLGINAPAVADSVTFGDIAGTKITWYTGFVTGCSGSVLYHDAASHELRVAGTARLTVSSTAVVAGAPVRLGAGGPLWTSGSGSPEGVVTAPVGSLYSNTSGDVSTALYRKTSGSSNTGWSAVSNTASWG